MRIFKMATGRTKRVLDVFFRLLSVVTFFTSAYLLIERYEWKHWLGSEAFVNGTRSAVGAYECGKKDLIVSDAAQTSAECFPGKLSQYNPLCWAMWMLSEPMRFRDDEYATAYNEMMQLLIERHQVDASQ
jgi:hypothetical protein